VRARARARKRETARVCARARAKARKTEVLLRKGKTEVLQGKETALELLGLRCRV